MTAVRGLPTAKHAAVDIRSGDDSMGHGLLLGLDRSYVLTCHHVVTAIDPSALRVVARKADGGSTSSPASVVPRLSHPEKDAVVLEVERDLGKRDRPWLHEPGPSYPGGRASTVVLSPRKGRLDTFDARLGAASENFTVPGMGDVERYVLPRAYPLGRPEEAAHGISGGVVVSEDGVVGLVHFARPESSELARGGVVNPLSAWADGWDELARRIQPFADRLLVSVARVVRADAEEELAEILRTSGFRDDVYVPRGVETSADEVWRDCRSLLLLGRARSGKTRIIKQLLRAHPEAVVLVPTYKDPPGTFEYSTFSDSEVVVLVENLGKDGTVFDPTDWWDRIRAIDDERTVFVATCRAEDWDRVVEERKALVERLERSTLYTSSPPEGNDLTREQGWELAERIGLTEAQFEERFDGTPGSLFEDRPGGDGPDLPSGRGTGIGLRDLQAHDAPSNIPAFTSTFVGRKEEVEVVKRLVRESPLVTITAPGGSGKTRLAFHAAAQLRDAFADGVWVAELSSYRTGAHVPSVVARAVGLGDAPAPPPDERLVAFLRDKRVLLVLNGCDHVRDASARLLEKLIERCPGLHCLTTCRSTLDARGEVPYHLDSLSAEPAAGAKWKPGRSEAAEFLVERAKASGSKKRFSRGDYSAIAEITRLVAGNPLALELVAGQVGGLAVRGIAAKLAERIATKEAEEAGSEVVEAAVDLVAGELPESERLLFGVVSVFVGGFTLEAAQALGAKAGLEPTGIPDLLRRLIDRQLVLIDSRTGIGERFRTLEAVRQQRRRQLVETGRLEQLERSHAEYFLGLAEGANAAKGEPGEAAWLDRLDGELENVRAALWWARQADTDVALRLGASLGWFWYQRGHVAEGRRWLRELLRDLDSSALVHAEDDETRRHYADLLNGAGTFAYIRGRLDEAEAHHREALAVREGLTADAWAVAGSQNNLGLVARRRGNKERAARYFRQALEISRAHGNAFWEAMHLNNLGLLERDWGERESARRRQEQSLTVAARLGASWGVAQALVALGVLDADDGRLDSAREFLERALAVHGEMQNPQGIAEALAGLGRVARLSGEERASVEHYREALEKVEQLGDRTARAELLEGLALTLVEGDPASAARAFGAAKRIRVEIGFPRAPAPAEEVEPGLQRCRELLGAEAFDEAYRAGLKASETPTVAELRAAQPA